MLYIFLFLMMVAHNIGAMGAYNSVVIDKSYKDIIIILPNISYFRNSDFNSKEGLEVIKDHLDGKSSIERLTDNISQIDQTIVRKEAKKKITTQRGTLLMLAANKGYIHLFKQVLQEKPKLVTALLHWNSIKLSTPTCEEKDGTIADYIEWCKRLSPDTDMNEYEKVVQDAKATQAAQAE